MAREVRIDSGLLRGVAATVEDAPESLVNGAAGAVSTAAGASTANPGFLTSQALGSFAEEVERTVQRAIQAFQNHARVLRGNADNYDRTEEDNRATLT